MKNIENMPVFIIEEHHEAFFIWHYGYFKGLIHPFGNTLLHIDAHDDMEIGGLKTSVDELSDDLKEIYDFTYAELGIASFIQAAIYKGIINNIAHLKKYDGFSGEKLNLYIASYKSQGKYFRTGEVTNHLRTWLHKEEKIWGNYSFFSFQEIGLQSRFYTAQPVILDIDLDFFSCDNSLSSVERKIEITKEAYVEFKRNKYHPFRIMPHAILSAAEEADKYYLYMNDRQEEANLKKVSYERIDRRIDNLVKFLKENQIQPAFIDICRSRFSGYTPLDQWQYIENRLLKALGEIYRLQVKHINELKEEDAVSL